MSGPKILTGSLFNQVPHLAAEDFGPLHHGFERGVRILAEKPEYMLITHSKLLGELALGNALIFKDLLQNEFRHQSSVGREGASRNPLLYERGVRHDNLN